MRRTIGTVSLALPCSMLLACTGLIDGEGMPEGTVGEPKADEPRQGAPGTGAGSPGQMPATGASGGAGGAVPPGSCTGAGRIGPSPLRRLTNFEYDNTIRDLLKIDSKPASDFPKDGEVNGLTNNVSQQGVTPTLADRYFGSAGQLAQQAAAGLLTTLRCDPAAAEDACARMFIDEIGLRAHRRPLAEEDARMLLAVYAAGRSGGDHRTGVQLVLEALLVSPQFLYKFETASGAPVGGLLALDGWSIASRLSYLLWGSMPDEELFAAARANKLGTATEIAAQAQRMIEAPRARAPIARMHREWLELDRLERAKDPQAFPGFTDALRTAMDEEVTRFLDHVFWTKGGNVIELMTGIQSFHNTALANFYGAPVPPGSGIRATTVDPVRRAGLLTKAGFIAAISKDIETGLVHRGQFVRERLLCEPVPPPPPGIDANPPKPDPKLTTRQRFTQHKTDPACAPCHQLMDPLGLAFENYDAVGAWRDRENGIAIDARGELTGAANVGDGRFNGVVEMAGKLAGSPTFHGCVATVWFRYAFGRSELPTDECTLSALGATLSDPGRGMKGLLTSLVQSDAFRYRTVSP